MAWLPQVATLVDGFTLAFASILVLRFIVAITKILHSLIKKFWTAQKPLPNWFFFPFLFLSGSFIQRMLERNGYYNHTLGLFLMSMAALGLLLLVGMVAWVGWKLGLRPLIVNFVRDFKKDTDPHRPPTP